MIAEGRHKLPGAGIACYCRFHATVWEEVKTKIKHYQYMAFKTFDRL